jgi:hypothetical protein
MDNVSMHMLILSNYENFDQQRLVELFHQTDLHIINQQLNQNDRPPQEQLTKRFPVIFFWPKIFTKAAVNSSKDYRTTLAVVRNNILKTEITQHFS